MCKFIFSTTCYNTDYNKFITSCIIFTDNKTVDRSTHPYTRVLLPPFFVLILLVDGSYMPSDAVFIFLRLLTNQLFRRQSVL